MSHNDPIDTVAPQREDLEANSEAGDKTQAVGLRFAADDDTAPTALRFGSYQVIRELGSGAFGSVYQARHSDNGSIVAIKTLMEKWSRDPECGPQMRAQFAVEAQMMLLFDHPHVVRVIALDDRADPPYFVQEFIDGETLAQRLLRGKPTLEETLSYAIQIADGLAHIHSRERWHRDLKPANILLDRDNQVHLADFGLALDDAQRWQSTRAPAGTFPYMAPEQIRGATHLLNARCDLWALGVILYEMLSGKRPFQGETRSQLCGEILERTPTSPREIIPEVPRKLNRICMQCLSKRDSDRPDAAADVREDLREVLARLRGGEDSAGLSNSDTKNTVSAVVSSSKPNTQYPVPTLRRFTAEQVELYLRLMPKSYNNPEELPELVGYWKQRIVSGNQRDAFRIGVMVGVSGCGKSSLLEAGLVPSLPPEIVPILIEASDTETESRILSKLRQLFPEADPSGSWNLADWTFRFREGQILAAGQKVVLILDQFEQWLNAHGGKPSSPLLDALHQCDGKHLQAIVCVREGFHATLMRFVQSAQVRLDEETNYATAHRFSLDHARFVLEQFGRGLKRLEDPITAEQRSFIEAAVEGLAESDRGVVCVRLVVLALVMQDRPWTAEELDKLGGLDGIGAQFLVDCFEGRTASEQYRRYLPAAMRVLADLLPAEGLEIKDVRSYEELLAASGLDKLQFDDLLSILTRKLFLLTIVEADTGASPACSGETIGDKRFTLYQLTHDFLVPSIREWLSRKLRETKEGRAQLRLQERTTAWTSKPENRNLPSLWEWLTIRRLTDRRKWKPSEQRVMRRAGRLHVMRSGLMASAIAILAMLGVAVRGQVVAQRELARVEALVAQLVTVEPAQLPDIVSQLQTVPELAEPLVAALLRLDPTSADERRSRLHAQLSTVGRDATLIEPLVEELLSNKVTYIGPIVELLQPHSAEVKDKLSSFLHNPTVEVNRRFRAGVALAGFVDPANAWDPDSLKLIADQLVSENIEYQPVLRENLRPIADQLLVPIEVVFQDAAASDAMRLGAAHAVADFAANNGELLTRLLADATPEQYQVLYPLVEIARPAEGIAELARIASTLPPDELGSVARIAYGQRRANAAVSLLRLGEREEVLPVFDYTDDPEALTQFIFRCRPRGIGPEPLLEVLDILTRRVSEGTSNDITSAAFQQNARARYAVLLSLGEFTLDELPVGRRESLIAQLSAWYAQDPSSGVHGASGWLLRQWGQTEIVMQVDQTPVPYSPDREWFTLAVEVQPKPFILQEEPQEGGEHMEAGSITYNSPWSVQFYHWPPAGPKMPPADWASVVNSEVKADWETSSLEFHWQAGLPVKGVDSDYFAAVATTSITLSSAPSTAIVTFDDGIRVYLDDEIIFEDWAFNHETSETLFIKGQPGHHTLKVEYFQINGGFALQWQDIDSKFVQFSEPQTFYYTFIVFPAGEFNIGSAEDEPERSRAESSEFRHPVQLTRPFALLDREVTLEELIAFSPQYTGIVTEFKANPKEAGFGPDWYDSVAFCRWLGEQAGYSESDQAYASPDSLDLEQYAREPEVNWAPKNWPLDLNKRGFRLPTEAEWQVATQSGSRTSYSFGSDEEHLGRFGWYTENSGSLVHVPRELLPSLRGLYDVHGNLSEWTHDWIGGFDQALATDPLGPLTGSYRVLRGGSWDVGAAGCRAAFRSRDTPTDRSQFYGFRLAFVPSGLSGSDPAEPFGVGTEGVAEQRPEMP